MKNRNIDRKNKTAKIITIYDPNPNYGNRLQNYAVQTVLSEMGLNVETISFQRDVLSGKRFLKLWLMRLSGYHLPGDLVYWKNYPKKVQKFKEFNKKYIKSRKIKDISDIGSADYFVLGSDQVWNPEWYDDCELKKDMYFLTFAKPEQKVCFSPSFSVENIPAEWEPWFKKWLSTFPVLGTREDSGAKIIKDLTEREAEVTIDPTLMLSKEKWRNIAKAPQKMECEDRSEKYILTYFLGGHSTEMDEILESYAGKIETENIYHMNDLNYPELYVADPSEFIYLIDHAQLVATDSFHACVFSFLFSKPFICFDRMGTGNSMNSRMETLFKKFDLQRKYVNSGLENELLECDYENGYKALEAEREKLLTFLKKSMGME